MRERREREKAVKDQFKMAGTVMGQILGVKKEDEEGPNEDGKRTDIQDDAFTVNAGKDGPAPDPATLEAEGGEGGDYRQDSMYGENAKKANVAQSEFARTKTRSASASRQSPSLPRKFHGAVCRSGYRR